MEFYGTGNIKAGKTTTAVRYTVKQKIALNPPLQEFLSVIANTSLSCFSSESKERREIELMEHHFYPQTWFCNLSHTINSPLLDLRTKFIRLNGSQAFVDAIINAIGDGMEKSTANNITLTAFSDIIGAFSLNTTNKIKL